MKKILLIVDPQNDFITGSLAVPGAKERMMKLADYIKERGYEYSQICITMDTHPSDHCSFKENGGIWPSHCVIHTTGWDLPEYLDDALMHFSNWSGKLVSFYHKGTDTSKEEYSIFDNEVDGNTLTNLIIDTFRETYLDIDVCGIAGDYCVLESLKGLRRIVGDMCIRVLTEYTVSIDGGDKLSAYLNKNEINYTKQ